MFQFVYKLAKVEAKDEEHAETSFFRFLKK